VDAAAEMKFEAAGGFSVGKFDRKQFHEISFCTWAARALNERQAEES
jgi:hypothetical protein